MAIPLDDPIGLADIADALRAEYDEALALAKRRDLDRARSELLYEGQPLTVRGLLYRARDIARRRVAAHGA